MKKALVFLTLGLAVVAAGCAHIYHVRVDAINGGDMAGKTFVIVPGNPNTPATDLQFREYAGYLTRALQSRGFVAASAQQPPEVEIYLSYGIGEPRPRVRTYAVPVWGQTGTEITTTEQTFQTKSGSNNITTTNITPEYGVTGYATEERVTTTYPKFVEIDAYEIQTTKPGAKMSELWKTTIHAEGRRNSLRRVFPILIAASAKYLGGNTHQEIEVALTADSTAVKMVKGIK